MYIQKIATILMDDEIHDILNEGNEYGLQEYIFISEPSDIDDLLKKLWKIHEDELIEERENLYITSTIQEIKQAIKLLEKDEIQSIVFVLDV